MFRSFRNQFQQVLSFRWLLAIFLAVLVYMAVASGFFEENPPSEMSVIGIMGLTNVQYLLLLFFPTTAFAASYVEDERSRLLPYWTVRTGCDRYVLSKSLVVASTGFLRILHWRYCLVFTCLYPGWPGRCRTIRFIIRVPGFLTE